MNDARKQEQLSLPFGLDDQPTVCVGDAGPENTANSTSFSLCAWRTLLDSEALKWKYLNVPLHLLEDGYDIWTIQELLGHRDVSAKTIYTHGLNRGGRVVHNLIDHF